jgi:succinate-acetate transporter protein
MIHESVKQRLHEIWTKAGPVESGGLTFGEIRTIEQRSQVMIGSPSALGFFGFATGTMVLAFVVSGILPVGAMIGVVPAILVFAGFAQFVAGLYAFSRGNAFEGTLFGSYGANYIVWATFVWMQHTGLISTDPMHNYLFGIGLLCLGYISLALGFAATKLNATYTVITWALVPGYVLPGLWEMGAWGANVGHYGGYCVFLSAIAAFYAGAALVINSTHEDRVLELGSTGASGRKGERQQ